MVPWYVSGKYPVPGTYISIRDNTWGTKKNIARTKILPYFGKRKIGEIEPRDIIAWQNELLAIRQPNGKPYSASYLQQIHSQLSAIFNHAVNFYHLPSNPAQKAGNMGKEEHREMLFWTKEEYLKFADTKRFIIGIVLVSSCRE